MLAAMTDQQHAEMTHDRAEEAIGRYPADVIDKVTSQRCATPARVNADGAGKSTAHSDAMETTREAGKKNQQVRRHIPLFRFSPQALSGLRQLFLQGEIGHPDEERNRHDDKNPERDTFGNSNRFPY